MITLRGIKIIIVLYSLELGGAEAQALLLAKCLKDVGADVEVWGFYNPGQVSRICEQLNITWRIIPIKYPHSPFGYLWSLIRLGLEIRKTKPDILLPFLTLPNVLCGILWRITGVRLNIWNQRNPGTEPISPFFAKLAASLTLWFISNSQHGAEYIIRKYSLKSHQVQVIYNGIDPISPQASPLEWRKQLRVKQETFVACMVANLTGYKDHTTLIKAWAEVVMELKNQNSEAVLVLAGRLDEKYEQLKTMVNALHIVDQVRFLGQVQDITGLLGAVDLGILSSHSEGCPNVVIEYMMAGLPVVGTDNPGIREVIGSEASQFLAPIGDHHLMAKLILQYAENKDLKVTYGIINSLRAQKFFSKEHMCRKYLEAIQSKL